MFDLHFHSNISDWENSLEEIIKESKNKKLEFLAITDHDKITNSNFLQLTKKSWIETCFSTEISARNYEHNKSLHLTFYAQNFSKEVNQILENTINKKIKMIKKQVEKLKQKWFFIDYNDFINYNIYKNKKIESLNKYNIATYLLLDKRNKTKIKKELKTEKIEASKVMQEYLKDWWILYKKYGLKFSVIWDYEPSLEICNKIKQKNNAILCIAHPNITFKKWIKEFEEVLPYYIEKWINAVEINSVASKKWLEVIFKAKEKFNLILTAGSDNHKIWEIDEKHWNFWKLNPFLDKQTKIEILNNFKKIIKK